MRSFAIAAVLSLCAAADSARGDQRALRAGGGASEDALASGGDGAMLFENVVCTLDTPVGMTEDNNPVRGWAGSAPGSCGCVGCRAPCRC